MQLICEKCNTPISYEGAPPKFCSECGTALSTVGDPDPTKAQPVDDEVDTRSMSDHLIGLDSHGDATVAPGSSGSAAATPTQDDGVGVGDQIGPYSLKRKLGQGGMGSVFEAVHQSTGQQVALKLLTAGNISSNEESVQRFRRESQIAASINHPRSTFVYEAGQHNDQIYITMELMPGGTLQDIVDEKGAMPVNRAVDCILDMIEGLQVAHDAGIVHRDIKPSNSFVDDDGRIKVGDFGLAKSVISDSSLTRTGMFMGTPQFAAPEQIKSGEIDERTDIYALGGTLFYLLAGRAPFTGNAAQVIASIASDTPPKVSEYANGVPRALTNLIAQTLEKDPNRRPLSLHMMRELLLPYSTSGASTADIGRRMAAYFGDIMIAACIGSIVGMFWPFAIMGLQKLGIFVDPFLASASFQALTIIAYFTISEGFFGRSVGKWMFGIRVIDHDGETPKIWQALLRACLIVGIPFVCSITTTSFVLDGFKMQSVGDIMGLFVKSQVGSLVSWVCLALVLCTARKSNGYRGIHETFSGTRVVRLSGDVLAKPLDRFEVTAPEKLSNEVIGALDFSPYVVLGRFREEPSGESVYLGKDPELDRAVWIFDNVQRDSINPIRKHLKRPHRLRVIATQKSEERTWYCTESNPGIPLVDVLDRSLCQWPSVRPILRDIAYELENAQEQNLLPANLTPSLLWLDHAGRVRLLDHAVVKSTVASDEPISPVDLLLQIIDRTFDHHSFPKHALAFRNELIAKKSEPGVLEWAGDQLAEMGEKPSTWNWDDRVGMFAVTIGLELSIISAFIFVSGFLGVALRLPAWLSAVFGTVGGLGLAGALSYLLTGGLAVRASGVAVCRNKDFRPASRFRCAIRGTVAWLPWTLMMASFVYLFAVGAASEQIEIVNNSARIDADNSVIPYALLLALLMFVVACFGTVWAVFNPARNGQDVVAGTRLLRK